MYYFSTDEVELSLLSAFNPIKEVKYMVPLH
jgi:hypothetical protein